MAMIAQFHKGEMVKASPLDLEDRVIYDDENLKTLKDFVDTYNSEVSSVDRNMVIGGRLITKPISEVRRAISNGTFEGLGIGDYFTHEITVDGDNYTMISIIVHFDPYFQKPIPYYEDTTSFAINQHHIALFHLFIDFTRAEGVSLTHVFAQSSATGYYGSDIQQYLSEFLFPIINSKFDNKLIPRNMKWTREVSETSVIYENVNDFITLPTAEQVGLTTSTDVSHEGYFEFSMFKTFHSRFHSRIPLALRGVLPGMKLETFDGINKEEAPTQFTSDCGVSAVTILA